jgi:hypothetical protein
MKLARLARPNRVSIMKRVFPENWVHENGRLVVVGNAAHPWPVRRSLPLNIQTSSITSNRCSLARHDLRFEHESRGRLSTGKVVLTPAQ